MIITHKLNWKECLSWQLWPAIEKGWKDEDRNIHFFWGLGGSNLKEIQEVSEKGEEWWYVDVGYLTQQITRYPKPIIHDLNKTYFRICKGRIHTTKGSIGKGHRLNELVNKEIDVEFKGWYTGETKHILIAPSSQTVTFHTNGINQDQWIYMVTEELKKYTDREIRVRNKPRPGNEWWNTDIKDDLKDCHCLVTNMSLASVDAILNKVPVICAGKNVAAPVSSRLPKFIEKPFRPGRKTIDEWLKFITEHQFTIPEIEKGIAYKTLKVQYED
ncbi:hypothetical protein N9C63_00455 [bacterium]|nr:hypothetical protein [bacterium]